MRQRRGLHLSESQLPVGVSVSSFDQATVPETRNFSVLADDGNVYSAGSNIVYNISGTPYAILGTAAPNAAGESTPVKYPLPGGVTATKLVVSRHDRYRVIVGSDGNVYSSGLNDQGNLGNGTTTSSSLPVAMQLPAGKTAVDAWGDYNQVFIKMSDDTVYATGCNYINSRCGGSLATGSSQNVLTPQQLSLPPGFVLSDVQGNGYSTFSFMGNDPYCDANGNDTLDAGEFPLQGQTVSLYPSASGSITGPAIATYNSIATEPSNVFYFDGLADGEYIAGITTTGGVLYSDPMTVTSGGGNGWVLGNASYVASISAMGQTGFVCGASTTVPNVPSTPGSTPGSPSTPSTLAPTGAKILYVYLVATTLVAASIALSTVRRRYIYRLAS